MYLFLVPVLVIMSIALPLLYWYLVFKIMQITDNLCFYRYHISGILMIMEFVISLYVFIFILTFLISGFDINWLPTRR